MRSTVKHTIGISITILCSIALVAMLAHTVNDQINKSNGFSRTVFPNSLNPLVAIPKEKDIVDIIGELNNKILFQTNRLGIIVTTDINLASKKKIKLDIPNDRRIASNYSYVLDSTDILVLAGNLPAIIKLNDTANKRVIKWPNSIFTQGVQVSHNSFVLRTFDKSDQIFIKGSPHSMNLLKESNISPKNNDAGITADGLLHYDKESNFIIYVHYFNNQIIALDTSLNLIYKSNTIDTTKVKDILAERVSKNALITNTAPKRIVNAYSCTHNGFLYNWSTLRADNETIETFSKNTSIDIYKISDGSYIGSFYVPDYQNDKISSFKIIDGKIIVVYKKHIVIFKLPKVIFNKI